MSSEVRLRRCKAAIRLEREERRHAEAEAPPTEREVPLATMSLLAFFVGIVAAAGAIGFRYLIGLIYNVAVYQTSASSTTRRPTDRRARSDR